MKIKHKTAIIAIDTETTGLSPWHGDMIYAVSMCDNRGTTTYYEWRVNPYTRKVEYNLNDIGAIKSILEDPTIDKVGHNIKFDMRMLEQTLEITTKGRVEETLFMSRCLNSIEDRIGLKELGQIYLDVPKDDEKELKAATRKARLYGKKQGWLCGKPRKVEEDYWAVKAMDPSNNLCEIYARKDAERTMMLFLLFNPLLDSEGVRETYERELKLLPIVRKFEDRGICISLKRNKEQIEHNQELVTRYLTELQKLTGDINFNPKSYPQKLRALKARGINLTRLTKTAEETGGDNLSTNWKALLPFRDDPLVHALFAHDTPKKALSTFFLSFQKKAVPDPLTNNKTHVIHTSFHQAGTKTGRGAMSDPNLQQVTTRQPQTGAEMPRARYPFRPRPNHVFYFIDYSQVELRIFADYSQEPTMLAAINSGRDLHTETANKAWGGKDNPAAIQAAINCLELQQDSPSNAPVRGCWKHYAWKPESRSDASVRRDMEEIAIDWLDHFDWNIVDAETSLFKKTIRSRAKEINFAKIYGSGPNGVKDLLFISYSEAKKFLAEYSRAMPRIDEFINEFSTSVSRNNYQLSNAYGRKVRVDPHKPYKAVNYLVQGGAADLIKDAMIRTHTFLKRNKLDLHLLLQIHDELMFEGRKPYNYSQNIPRIEDAYWYPHLREIQNIMEDHQGRFGVNLPTEISRASSSWDVKKGLYV